jgi:CelD/BcsL family acetyltransferase involved in cellulose biosynthesis
VNVSIIDSAEELERIRDGWDRLAVAVARPYCSPGWLLPWWRHVSPSGALLRTVAVEDRGRLVAVAPYFMERGPGGLAEYRPLGRGAAQRLTMLADPGSEAEAAEAITGALAEAEPQPRSVRLEAIDADSPWPDLLRAAWPARPRPWAHRDGRLAAPTLRLEGTYENWLASKPGKFRGEVGRGRRKLEAEGGRLRMSRDFAEAERDLKAFFRLHVGRFEGRGGSSAVGPGMERMLLDAARAMVPEGRLRLWMVDLGDETIGASILLAAGGEVVGWSTGFDERYSRLQPGILMTMATIEDAFTRGDRRLDLGGGAHPYKLRFASGDAPIEWVTLFPRDRRYPLTRAQVAPRHLREKARAAAQRLSPETRRRIKRRLSSLRRTGSD